MVSAVELFLCGTSRSLAHTAAGTGAVFSMHVIACGAIGHGVGAAA